MPLISEEGAPSRARREVSPGLGDHLFLLGPDGVFRFVPSAPGPVGNILVESDELASVVTDAALLSASTGAARILRICSQFEQLINDPNADERIFQEFFEEYPDFLLADQYEALYPQVVLPMGTSGATLRPDFILRPFAGMTHEPEIVELKLPRQPIVKLNRSHVGLYSPIHDAIAQLRSYARVFSDEGNRAVLAEQLGFTVYRPSLALVVGRTANLPSQRLAALAREGIEPVRLHTYDDLLLRYRRRAGL
jgi:hypothetical protein